MVGNTKWMKAKAEQLRVTWISSELQKQTHLVRRTRDLFDSSNGCRKNRLPRPASLEITCVPDKGRSLLALPVSAEADLQVLAIQVGPVVRGVPIYNCCFLYPESCPAKRFLRASPPASKNEAW